MIISKKDISSFDRIYRLKLINSLSGLKPANLIGSKSKDGISNLAIFSSVVHLGSDPALLGFILRPRTVERHTYQNIIDHDYYTINHVHPSFVKQAHLTSAKWEKSEFEECNLTEEYLAEFPVPFVAESKIKIGLKFAEKVDLKINDTALIIGYIEFIKFTDPDILLEDGDLDYDKANSVAVSGLNTYHEASEILKIAYARPIKDNSI